MQAVRGRAISLAAVMLAMAGGYAQAQNATASANRIAYESALKCFVANGRADGVRRQAGNHTAADAYERGARTSFDAAVRMGQLLGYSNQRVNEDFGIVQARELPRMVADSAYFREVIGTCRALGLMPTA